MKSITLPLKIVNQMLDHAQRDEVNEVCGLVSSRAGIVKSIYPIPNTSTDPVHLYSMDAKSQVDAMRTIRETDEQLYGIYHSHPNSAAFPSVIDVNEAQYPEAIYFIISLDNAGVLDLRGYRLAGKEIEVLSVVAT